MDMSYQRYPVDQTFPLGMVGFDGQVNYLAPNKPDYPVNTITPHVVPSSSSAQHHPLPLPPPQHHPLPHTHSHPHPHPHPHPHSHPLPHAHPHAHPHPHPHLAHHPHHPHQQHQQQSPHLHHPQQAQPQPQPPQQPPQQQSQQPPFVPTQNASSPSAQGQEKWVRLNVCIRCGICLTCSSSNPQCGCKPQKPQRGGKTIPNSGGRLLRNPNTRDSRAKSLLSSHPDHDIIVEWLSLNAHEQFSDINFWTTTMTEVSACKTCDSNYNRYCKKMRSKRRSTQRLNHGQTNSMPMNSNASVGSVPATGADAPRLSLHTPPESPENASVTQYASPFSTMDLW